MKKILPASLLFLATTSFAQETAFTISKLINGSFKAQIKTLTKITEQNINKTATLQIYKEKESQDDGPEWNYNAVIRIDGYFYAIKLGINHTIEAADIAGNDNIEELIVNTGCFSDAGCLEKLMIIRIEKNQPFTITDFGEAKLATDKIDLFQYYGIDKSIYPRSLYKNDLNKIKKAGEFAVISTTFDQQGRKCFLLIKSYKLSTKGFSKGFFFKKVRKICAG